MRGIVGQNVPPYAPWTVSDRICAKQIFNIITIKCLYDLCRGLLTPFVGWLAGRLVH